MKKLLYSEIENVFHINMQSSERSLLILHHMLWIKLWSRKSCWWGLQNSRTPALKASPFLWASLQSLFSRVDWLHQTQWYWSSLVIWGSTIPLSYGFHQYWWITTQFTSAGGKFICCMNLWLLTKCIEPPAASAWYNHSLKPLYVWEGGCWGRRSWGT